MEREEIPVASTRTKHGFPAWVRKRVLGPNGDPDMDAKIEVSDDGRPEVTSLIFTTKPDGRGLRTADLASVNVDQLIYDTYRSIAGLMPHLTADAPKRAERARRGRPRKVTPALLAEVARVYTDNADHHPVKAVGHRFGVERRQASYYVQQARAEGHFDG